MNGEKIKRSIERIGVGSVYYPALLKEIKGFPKELFYIGDPKLLKKRCVAIVGSRNTTGYGRSVAVSMAGELARKDVAVVSGMARGIDTCVHRGALKVGGSTIAVLGCGVDVCYPDENNDLKAAIEADGLVLSEYPPGTPAKKYHFPQRNRIISGLSEITVVVQARNRSGALITAELAAEQGREVCAVPGNIDSQYNLGNNKLIKEGAYPITNVKDVCHLMGLEVAGKEQVRELLSDTEMRLFTLLENHGEMSMEQLCRMMGKPVGYVTAMATVMEMKGVVFSELGKIFIAKE